MKRDIELLAPGGDLDSIKVAIAAGADAIYCGLNKFNARNRAVNISFEQLQGVLRVAHKSGCKIFLTLNIVVVDSEIPALVTLLNRLVNSSIDGVIVQDLGMFYILSKYFKTLDIHASTQLTTHNRGQLLFLKELDASRVNLSRELNIEEIEDIATLGLENSVLTEVFVHGSNCISFSGLCYISSVQKGNSGNRGRCSQPCRDQYIKTETGFDYPLNLKDNLAIDKIEELYSAGVSSLKIEGRIKKPDYVYTVVDIWRRAIDSRLLNLGSKVDHSNLYKVFNRDFSDSYLSGSIGSTMFIDNPRDNSVNHILSKSGSKLEFDRERIKLYQERDSIKSIIDGVVKDVDLSRAPVNLTVSGRYGTPLEIEVRTPDRSFTIVSKTDLTDVGREPIGREMLLKRLKSIDDTSYYLNDIDLTKLKGKLHLSFKELTSIKRELLYKLTNLESVSPVELPKIERFNRCNEEVVYLSVLISSFEDVPRYLERDDVKIYFQISNSIVAQFDQYLDLFSSNRDITPWFPALLIGEEYSAALELISQLNLVSAVTDNSGVAYELYKRDIGWIAGPQLNIVNSYSLKCLKETFNCSGAFISNEMSKVQIKGVRKPSDFNLYYNIYYPIMLMVSRQCISGRVVGCHKEEIDSSCLSSCYKESVIESSDSSPLLVKKYRGSYHTIYNSENFLNLDIVKDFPELFSSYFIDLRAIDTATSIDVDRVELIDLFNSYVAVDRASERLEYRVGNISEERSEDKFEVKLKEVIHNTTNHQYIKGL